MQPAILLVLLTAAAASSIGGLLLCLRAWSQEALFAMISAGGGLLLAITLLDLLPHTVAAEEHVLMPFVLLGFASLFVLELIGPGGSTIGPSSLIGVFSGFMFHAFVEGVSLMASFRLDAKLGMSVLLALVLHKIPDGVTIGSILLAVTNSRKKAFGGAAALGIATLAGAFSMGVVEQHLPPVWAPVTIALTTGVFLYVSASHLVPLIQHTKRLKLGVYFFAAVLAYMLLSTFLHMDGHAHA
jgi:zinc transporter ZupT